MCDCDQKTTAMSKGNQLGSPVESIPEGAEKYMELIGRVRNLSNRIVSVRRQAEKKASWITGTTSPERPMGDAQFEEAPFIHEMHEIFSRMEGEIEALSEAIYQM